MNIADHLEEAAVRGMKTQRLIRENECLFKPGEQVMASFWSRKRTPAIPQSESSIRRHREKMRNDPSYAAQFNKQVKAVAVVIEAGQDFCRVAKVNNGRLNNPVTRFTRDLEPIPNKENTK